MDDARHGQQSRFVGHERRDAFAVQRWGHHGGRLHVFVLRDDHRVEPHEHPGHDGRNAYLYRPIVERPQWCWQCVSVWRDERPARMEWRPVLSGLLAVMI